MSKCLKRQGCLWRRPPQAVKSILVWNAKTVRAKVTPAVIPTWNVNHERWWERSGVRYPIWFNSMGEFCQKMINLIFDSILLYPRFNSKYYSIKKNSADSIQKIIQFNSQGLFDTGRIGKVPENCPKSVQNRQKRGLFIKNGKYRFKIWFIHSFHGKIQFKGLFNIIFFRNIQFKKLFNNFFSRKIQFKNRFKNLNLALFNSTKYSFN